MERATGFEPVSLDWQTSALPTELYLHLPFLMRIQSAGVTHFRVCLPAVTVRAPDDTLIDLLDQSR